MSKVHKKVTFKQLSGHANKFRSQILCGLEKFILRNMFYLDYGSVFMKKQTDNSWCAGVVLMQLFKAYDWILHTVDC